MTVHTSPDTLAGRAEQLLTALGRTEHQVAQRLFEGGHFGEPGKCGACPIAVYLLSSGLGLRAVQVGAVVRLFPTDHDADMVTVCLPDPALLFMESFDGGGYDELVTDGGEQGMTLSATKLAEFQQIPAITDERLRELQDIWTAHVHNMTADDFTHEAERVECFQPSPAAARMRQAIDAERDARQCELDSAPKPLAVDHV